MSDYKIPELPSDEELGIAGMSEEDFATPPPPPPPGKKAGGPAGGPPTATPGEKAPPLPSPRGPRWWGPAALAALIVVAFLTSSSRTLPRPAPATAPDSAFSSGRALVDLVEMARRPHPPGSPDHDRVRDHLTDRLADLGLTPQVQATTRVRGTTSRATAVTVRNILARLPGTASTGAIVLTAHYDSRVLSRGAGDDGTGVATILETVRALRAGPALRNDVIVLLTDAEELGLWGARAFVEEHPWMADVSLVLSVEMRGGGGPSIMFETSPENGWIVDALAASDPRPSANSLGLELYRRMPNDTDFTPFREAGVQGLNFAGIGRAHVYHQSYDDPEHLQEATLQHHGVRLLAVTRELGGRDLATVTAPDRAYLSLPFLGLLHWPTSQVLLHTGGLVLLFLLVAGLAFLRGARAGRVMLGSLLALLLVGASAAAGWGLFAGVQRFHPELGALQGSAFHREGPYVLGLAFAVLLLTGLLFGTARRWSSGVELALGALLLPTVGAVAVTFVAPAAAMNLQIPTAAALLAVAILSVPGARRRMGPVTGALGLLLAIPALAVMVPLVELSALALSLAAAPVLGGVMAVAGLTLLPALENLDRPNRWWAPLTGLVVAAAAVGLGILRAQPSARYPAPSTLLYVMDRGEGGDSATALWATDPDGSPWPGERVATMDSEATLEAYLLGSGTYATGPAQAVASPLPVVVRTEEPDAPARGGVEREPGAAPVPLDTAAVAPDTTAVAPDTAAVAPDTAAVPSGAEPVPSGPQSVPPGTIRLSIRSTIGAEMLAIRLGTGGRFLAVGGRSLPEDEGGRVGEAPTLVHYGRPDPVLTVDVLPPPGEASPTVEIIEHHYRPWELVGEEPFTRPPELAPDIQTRSDRAVIRTRLTLPDSGGP